MNINEFQRLEDLRSYAAEHLPQMIRERLSDRQILDVFARNSYKNNGTVRLGITVVSEQKLSPCIYIEPYIPPDPAVFQQEGVWDKIADRLALDFRYALDALEPNPEELYQEKDISERLILRAVNHDRNEKLISMYPHRDYLNLSILMEWETTCGGRTGYIYITDQVLEVWGSSFDELYEVALKNTMRKYPGRFEPLGDVLKDILGEDPGTFLREDGSIGLNSPFYYLGTTRVMQGAVALIYPGILKEVYRTIGEPFYVIPSSVNELLVLPCSFEKDRAYLNNLVWEVNTYVLDRSEILSDVMYVYDPESEELEIIE